MLPIKMPFKSPDFSKVELSFNKCMLGLVAISILEVENLLFILSLSDFLYSFITTMQPTTRGLSWLSHAYACICLLHKCLIPRNKRTVSKDEELLCVLLLFMLLFYWLIYALLHFHCVLISS